MKKIILDFETTNVSVFKAKVLEICALFIENNIVVEEYYKKVRFDNDYDFCDKSTVDALNFNKIFSQQDLDKHNVGSISEKDMVEEFLRKVEKFGKLVITGWNNATYDNIILKKILEENDYDFIQYFDYHVKDVCCEFRLIWENFYKDKFNLHLKDAHQYLFPDKIKDENFHSANYDCYATLDMDIWVEKFYERIKDEIDV